MSRARWLPLGLGLVGLGLTLGVVACGGSGDDDDTPTAESSRVATGFTPGASITPRKPPPSTGGTAGGPSPVLPEPAARYTVLESELPKGLFEPHPPNTYFVNRERFEQLGQFKSGLYAIQKITDWGFVEGWNVEYRPLARLSALLDGGFYLTVETYLFATPEGAHEAFESFTTHYNATPGSLQESPAPLGNESAGFSVIQGTVSRTDVANIYHRFLFRRGNLIGIVQTVGAEPFMSIDVAREFAVKIDERALGNLPAEPPTAIPTAGR